LGGGVGLRGLAGRLGLAGLRGRGLQGQTGDLEAVAVDLLVEQGK
jgi:hypothetical protein